MHNKLTQQVIVVTTEDPNPDVIFCWQVDSINPPEDRFQTVSLNICHQNQPLQKFEISSVTGLARPVGSSEDYCLSTVGRGDNEAKLKHGPCLHDVWGNFDFGMTDAGHAIRPFGSVTHCISADSQELRRNELLRYSDDCAIPGQYQQWVYDETAGQIKLRSNDSLCMGIDKLKKVS